MLERVLSYFSSLDLDGTDDPVLLQKPLDKADGYERQIILNKETCIKLEALLSKCTVDQLTAFYRKLSVRDLAVTKMGSQAIEKMHRNLFRHVYLSGMSEEDARRVLGTVQSSVEPHVETLLFDQFGTFVLRPYFELLAGKSTGYVCAETQPRPQKGKIRKFPRHRAFYKALKAYSGLFGANLERIFATSYASATFAVYLRCTRDRVLIARLLDTHFSPESLRSPVLSYFFEDLAECARPETLDAMLAKIGPELGPLGLADFSNYVVRVLAERCPPQKVYAHMEGHLDQYPKNSNVVLSLLRGMYRSHEFTLFLGLVHRFYGPESLFESLLLDNGKIVYKHVEIAALVMSLSERHEHVKSFNADFLRLFDKSWLYEAPGRELTRAFLMGSAAPRSKRLFIAEQSREYERLARGYYGKKLLVTMSRHSDNSRRLEITALLKRHARTKPACRPACAQGP